MKIIGILLLMMSSFVSAETLRSAKATKSLADKMVANFAEKKFSEGLNLAKKYWPLSGFEIDDLASEISTQWPIIDQRFGGSVGYEFIKKETIGDSFIRYYYLHKFKNHAVYWRITFYEPSKGWLFNEVKFQDDLDVLFRVAN